MVRDDASKITNHLLKSEVAMAGMPVTQVTRAQILAQNTFQPCFEKPVKFNLNDKQQTRNALSSYQCDPAVNRCASSENIAKSTTQAARIGIHSAVGATSSRTTSSTRCVFVYSQNHIQSDPSVSKDHFESLMPHHQHIPLSKNGKIEFCF